MPPPTNTPTIVTFCVWLAVICSLKSGIRPYWYQHKNYRGTADVKNRHRGSSYLNSLTEDTSSYFFKPSWRSILSWFFEQETQVWLDLISEHMSLKTPAVTHAHAQTQQRTWTLAPSRESESRRPPTACPENASSAWPDLQNRFTLQTVKFYPFSQKPQRPHCSRDLLYMYKGHSLLNGTILYASELARIFLLMCFVFVFFLLDV